MVDYNLQNLNYIGYEYFIKLLDALFKTVIASSWKFIHESVMMTVRNQSSKLNVFECKKLLVDIDKLLERTHVKQSAERGSFMQIRNYIYTQFKKQTPKGHVLSTEKIQAEEPVIHICKYFWNTHTIKNVELQKKVELYREKTIKNVGKIFTNSSYELLQKLNHICFQVTQKKNEININISDLEKDINMLSLFECEQLLYCTNYWIEAFLGSIDPKRMSYIRMIQKMLEQRKKELT